MIPNPNHMIEMLCRLERQTHQSGWEGEARLGLILRGDDGAYRAQTFPVSPASVDNDLEISLRAVADAFLAGPRTPRPKTRGGNKVCAFWVGFTGLFHERETHDVAVMKVLTAIDCGGNTYAITRQNGDRVELSTFSPGRPTGLGGVTTALRDILLHVIVNFPITDADVVNVSKVAG